MELGDREGGANSTVKTSPAESKVVFGVLSWLLADSEIEQEVSFSPRAKQCFKLACWPAETALRFREIPRPAWQPLASRNTWFWAKSSKRRCCCLELSSQQYASNNITTIAPDHLQYSVPLPPAPAISSTSVSAPRFAKADRTVQDSRSQCRAKLAVLLNSPGKAITTTSPLRYIIPNSSPHC